MKHCRYLIDNNTNYELKHDIIVFDKYEKCIGNYTLMYHYGIIFIPNENDNVVEIVNNFLNKFLNKVKWWSRTRFSIANDLLEHIKKFTISILLPLDKQLINVKFDNYEYKITIYHDKDIMLHELSNNVFQHID